MLRQEDADIPDFRLDVPRAVALRAGQIDFGQLLRHLCERIDLHHVTHGQMVMDGLDESFYRVIAMMLRPDVFVATAMDTDSQQSSGKSSSCPPQSLKERFPEPSIAGKPLSSREFQLLNLLMSGKTYTQITDLMDVSLSTVQSHVRAIYRKLDAHSKTQAIHHAKQRGFI
jgi:DNA-binding NarL/FixJ family response regulator